MKIETFGFVRSRRWEQLHEDGDVISMMPGAASVCADFGRGFHAYRTDIHAGAKSDMKGT